MALAKIGFSGFFTSKNDMAFFKSFLVVPQIEGDANELPPIEQIKKFAWSEFGAKLCGTLFGPCILLLMSPEAPFLIKQNMILEHKLVLFFMPLIILVALPFMYIANLVDLLGSLVNTLIEACQKDENPEIAYDPM